MPVFRDHYLGKTDPRNPLASPVFGDYRGIPPLLIQVGEHEMLRDDSVRVAKKARSDGIPVKLEVWPGMFHVFQSHEPLLPEGVLIVLLSRAMFVADNPAASSPSKRRQRLAEVAGGEAAQVEHGQDLGHLRGAAHVRRQDAAREPSPLAVLVGPSVVHAGRAHRDRPGPDRDLPGAALAVADDQGVAVVVAFVAVRLQVRGDLGFRMDALVQHPGSVGVALVRVARRRSRRGAGTLRSRCPVTAVCRRPRDRRGQLI